jgi:hypothetical protein
MKTKEEVKYHLEHVGFTDAARVKIMGFAIGSGLKENDEVWNVLIGKCTWNDFYEWFISDERNALQKLIEEIITKREGAKTTEERVLRSEQLGILLELLEEYEENE